MDSRCVSRISNPSDLFYCSKSVLSDEPEVREGKVKRFFCTLSLSEGETIRRVIHMQHPVLKECALALRSLEGGIIDKSDHFWKEPVEKVAPLCTEALKFINCEMYYKDEELEILERALYGAPLEMRKVPSSHLHFPTSNSFYATSFSLLLPLTSRANKHSNFSWTA
jgi:hypothetical protein